MKDKKSKWSYVTDVIIIGLPIVGGIYVGWKIYKNRDEFKKIIRPRINTLKENMKQKFKRVGKIVH